MAKMGKIFQNTSEKPWWHRGGAKNIYVAAQVANTNSTALDSGLLGAASHARAVSRGSSVAAAEEVIRWYQTAGHAKEWPKHREIEQLRNHQPK